MKTENNFNINTKTMDFKLNVEVKIYDLREADHEGSNGSGEIVECSNELKKLTRRALSGLVEDRLPNFKLTPLRNGTGLKWAICKCLLLSPMENCEKLNVSYRLKMQQNNVEVNFFIHP